MRKQLAAALAISISASAFAADAHQLYSAKCNACHGKDGKGTSVGQKMGAPDLTKITATEADVAATITNGKGKMTPFGTKLSLEEIQALAKFVKGGLK
jgi:mono/diheme cytochrome c family protein